MPLYVLVIFYIAGCAAALWSSRKLHANWIILGLGIVDMFGLLYVLPACPWPDLGNHYFNNKTEIANMLVPFWMSQLVLVGLAQRLIRLRK